VIRLVERTLADLAVDAVVRAADERLQPVGPASEELDQRAGDRLRQLRQVQAPLDVGAAVITGAGDLAAEFVLHIVVQGAERAATRETVRKALVSAWHRAEGWQLSRVGARLAGLGGPGLSLQDAAVALVETFRDRPRTTGFPAELHIVIDDSEQRQTVEPLLGEAS
jgi:O-acetyl-ADP-ribose deacetylase (regulator of RNase III)